MKESKQRIPCELCHNHFERVENENPCSICPSKVENEDYVNSISELLRKNMVDEQIADILDRKPVTETWVKVVVIGIGVLSIVNTIILLF